MALNRADFRAVSLVPTLDTVMRISNKNVKEGGRPFRKKLAIYIYGVIYIEIYMEPGTEQCYK